MSHELLFWYGLTLKMAMTAAIVVIASVAVERSGPFIGALIASLPTAAGAAYIILAIEHPPDFIAASAVGSVAINAAIAIFAAAYALLAQRRGLVLSLGAATALWFAGAALLRIADWTPFRAVLLNAAVFAFTIPATWRYRTSAPPPKIVRTALDIPLRALTAAIVVAVVTSASYRIGSFASGMFALFPIVLGSFIVILHPRVGGVATAAVLAHFQIALVGLGLGFLVVHYVAVPIGVWWSFAIGLAVCIGWNGLLWLVRARTRKRRSV